MLLPNVAGQAGCRSGRIDSSYGKVIECERQRDRDIKRDTETETERERDVEKERDRERETERDRERDTDREGHRYTAGQREGQRDREAETVVLDHASPGMRVIKRMRMQEDYPAIKTQADRQTCRRTIARSRLAMSSADGIAACLTPTQ